MASFDDPLRALSLPQNPGPNPADQIAAFIQQSQQRPQAPPMAPSPGASPMAAQPPRSGSRIKSILESFVVGGAEALQKQLGIETPEEQAQREQETQQKRQWQQSQLEVNQAQIENLHSEVQKRNQPAPTPIALDAQAFQYKVNVEGKTPAQAYAEVKQEAQKPPAPPSHAAPSFEEFKADYLARNPKATYVDVTRAWYKDSHPHEPKPASGGSDSTIEQQAQDLVAGRIAPSQLSKRAATYGGTLARADEIARAQGLEGFDAGAAESRFQSNKALLKDFTSGQSARNLTAFNTASGHLAQLGGLVDALGNGNTTVINRLGQIYAKATGSPAPTNFDSVRNAAVGEVAKLFSGGVVAQAEREEIQKPLENSNSPAQLKQAIEQLRHLMESRKSALQNQYEQAKKGLPAFDSAEPKTDPFAQFGGKTR